MPVVLDVYRTLETGHGPLKTDHVAFELEKSVCCLVLYKA